jgi:hypothetical protein
MRLYPDDFVLITRALFGALAAQGAYLRAAARPILLVAIVAVPVFLQLEARYSRAPLAPGSRTIVTARLKPGLDVRSVPTALAASDSGVRVDSICVRAPIARDVTWRVQVVSSGSHQALLSAYDQVYRFPIEAQKSGRAIGEERSARAFAASLTDIGLPEIGRDSALDRVQVGYPPATYRVFGARLSWIGAFLAATLIGAMIPAIWLRVAL